MRRLVLPYEEEALESIESGEGVILSGVLYVGRDQVHKRLSSIISEGGPLPFDFSGNAEETNPFKKH